MVKVVSVSRTPGKYCPRTCLKELATLFGILLEVLPYAYLKVCPEVNVLMVKSPGGLNEVGFLIFEMVRVRAVYVAMGMDEGKVTLTVFGVAKLQARLLLTKGAVMPQVDDTLGTIYEGNSIKITEPSSMTGTCLMVNW